MCVTHTLLYDDIYENECIRNKTGMNKIEENTSIYRKRKTNREIEKERKRRGKDVMGDERHNHNKKNIKSKIFLLKADKVAGLISISTSVRYFYI